MKELVEVIAKALVDCPDEVVVTETENEKAIVLELRVAQSDMGKVIGKQGRIAKAIRSVVKAAASKSDCGDYAVIFAVNRRDHEHGAAGFFFYQRRIEGDKNERYYKKMLYIFIDITVDCTDTGIDKCQGNSDRHRKLYSIYRR